MTCHAAPHSTLLSFSLGCLVHLHPRSVNYSLFLHFHSCQPSIPAQGLPMQTSATKGIIASGNRHVGSAIYLNEARVYIESERISLSKANSQWPTSEVEAPCGRGQGRCLSVFVPRMSKDVLKMSSRPSRGPRGPLADLCRLRIHRTTLMLPSLPILHCACFNFGL